MGTSLNSHLGGLIPRSEIARSYSSSILNFWRYLHTISLYPPIYILTSTVYESSLFSTPLPTLLFLTFLIIAILTGVRCCQIVGLICVSIIISAVEHLFMYLLAFCILYLENVSSVSLPIFKPACFCCWVVWVLLVLLLFSLPVETYLKRDY